MVACLLNLRKWTGGHFCGFLWIVGEAQQVEVARRDGARGQDDLLQPIDEAGPVRGAKEHDRKVLDLSGLRERERFEQLIQRAQPARKYDEPARVLDEHVLAHEEVAELDPEVHVLVHRLLMRELDVAADRQPTRVVTTFVDRLHDPRPAAGDDGKSTPGERRAESY